MSTMELDEAMAPEALEVPAPPADPDLRTYRGKTLEELLPKIRDELGPDAIVVRQRDGLMGGIGGFFQQQFVEIEARAGHPRIDVYDEEPAAPGEGFAALLAAAEEHAEPTVEALTAPVATPVAAPPAPPAPKLLDALADSVREAALAAPPVPRTRPAAKPDDLAGGLISHGLSERFVTRLLADATAHELPFATDLHAAAGRALARRIPLPPARRAGPMAIAFAGPAGAGKTHCVAALATAYARSGTPILCIAYAAKDGGTELMRLLAPAGVEVHAVASAAGVRTQLGRAPQDALVVLDTAAVSLTDPAAITELAEALASFGLDETQLVLPATLDAEAAHDLHERLAPLRPTGIALTHADPDSGEQRIGPAVELACATRLPLAYLATAAAIAPADPVTIAERLLS